MRSTDGFQMRRADDSLRVRESCILWWWGPWSLACFALWVALCWPARGRVNSNVDLSLSFPSITMFHTHVI